MCVSVTTEAGRLWTTLWTSPAPAKMTLYICFRRSSQRQVTSTHTHTHTHTHMHTRIITHIGTHTYTHKHTNTHTTVAHHYYTYVHVQTYFSVTLEWQYSIDLLFSMGEVRNHWAFIPKQCIWSAFQNEINQLIELNFFSFLNENPNLLCDHQSLECLIQLTISYHSATCFLSAKNTFETDYCSYLFTWVSYSLFTCYHEGFLFHIYSEFPRVRGYHIMWGGEALWE